MPVYKAEKYLDKCIGSILAQTYSTWELILVDDGSPDRSGEICDAYALQDIRIKVIHTPNGGPSSARNTGIDHARGEFLMFVDSDDWVSPEYIQNLLPVDGEDMVNCGFVDLVDGKQIESSRSEAHITDHAQWRENFRESFSKSPLMGPCGNSYRREIIEKYHIRFHTDIDISEDELFNLEYLQYCNRVRYSDSADYFYTICRSGSLMNRHHPCRTVSVMKIAQAKEALTGKVEYGIRWGEWHIAISHHGKWLKVSKGKTKKQVAKCLRESYRNAYFRECISYMRKYGTLDQKVETFFMNRFLHPMYPWFYKIIVLLSRLKQRCIMAFQRR